MLDNSSLVKLEHKKWALCVRLIGSSGQVTEVTRVVFLAGVTGLPVVTMATASRQLSGAPTCKGRSDVAGKWEIWCQEIRFPRRELIFPKNVRSSARSHRNVRQLCPRPNSLNNIGLKGPARGAPRAGHGYISVEPGYLGYRGCTWSCAHCALWQRGHTARVLSCGRFLTCSNMLVPRGRVVIEGRGCFNVRRSYSCQWAHCTLR